MNNKGFAITSIIYTLFILFLMILLSVLSCIRVSQRNNSNNVYNLKTNLETYEKIENTSVIGTINNNIQLGRISIPDNEDKYYLSKFKYIFEIKNSNIADLECVAYLNHEMDVNDLVMSPIDCNDYKHSLKLKEIYFLKGWG